jgi:bacillolysin
MPSVPSAIRRFLRPVAVVAALALALIVTSEYLRAQNPPQGVEQDPTISPRERAECLAAGEARTSRAARTGAIRFIGTEAGRPIPHPRPLGAAASPEAAARAYLSACGSLFGLRDQAAELGLTRSAAAGGARSVVRFQQWHRGIPIIGAQLVVHVDGDRNILAAAGETLPQVAVETAPGIDAAAAIETALDVTGKAHGVERTSLRTTPPELWIYAPGLIGPGGGPATLVWRMDVTTVTLQPIRELVLVDAVRGSVPLHFNQVETARNRNTYTASNTTALPGTLVCNEANSACAGGDADAIAAHIYAGDTYNYYLVNHGRDSLNNAGMNLTSTTHFGPAGYQNAFWNGAQVAYGDGFSRADDVVAHELTHGVTQFTANLFYYYQSGAINESFSDVFGEIVDLANGRGNDATAVRWLMGEDVPAGGAIRNMQDPTAFGDPDRMTSPFYYAGAADNGGVHFNSGINNKAAYLMVDGGTFNGQTVAPLGATKVGKIYYEVQTHLLTSGADYADLHDALYQGCANLIGVAGIVAADCQQVRNATLAVEMHLQPFPGFNAEAPICPGSQTPSYVFFDTIEGGSNNFSFTAPDARWSVVNWFAHSGLRSLYADDFPPAVSDSSASTVSQLVLPANAFLHFAHAYGFETPNYDGGVVEYSTNAGATWNDAGPLFDANGYTGVISTQYDNPLLGRAAFVAASHGYISSRLNLSSLAGQAVRFRWRLGLDFSVYDWGWWVDDVRIYTCADAGIVSASPSSGRRGQASLNVTLTGASTHFLQGQTVASFGSLITVNSTTVTDATHATANVTIAAAAALGPRAVTVTTGGEVATGLVFSVLDPLRPRMAIETPALGSTIPQPFVLSGWAIDESAASGTGVDAVHVWAFPSGGGAPSMVGAANYGTPRPDIASQFGAQFVNAGWNLVVRGLAPGFYTLQAHGHSTLNGTFNQFQSVAVVVQAAPRMAIDAPADNTQLIGSFNIGGWALDLAAANGTGVDAIHVWGYPNPGSGAPAIFFGAATYAAPRPDVGAAFGAQFTNSGYNLTVSGIPSAFYRIYVYTRSTVTGTFSNVRFFHATVIAGQLMALDSPAAGSTLMQPFDLTGWAIDRGAPAGTGVDALHVWAYRDPGSNTPPVFVGAGTYGLSRPDVGSFYGSRFTNSGYLLRIRGLSAGRYSLVVYAHSTATGTFNNLVSREVTVEAGPRLSIDTPANGAHVSSSFHIGGWALDNPAVSGTGMDAIHVWAYPNPGSGTAPIFLGAASYGGVRADVGAYFGAQFTNSGYNLPVTGLAPGVYQINVFGHSAVTGTFNIVQSVVVTVGGP